LVVATPLARAEPAASPPSPSSSGDAANQTASWKQIYEDGQTDYYVSAASPAQAGEAETESLMEFKIPQVVDGAQVWSVVSRMKLNCDQKQLVTLDSTSHALRMGAGPVIQAQAAGDTWHQPEAGSLGELILSTACVKS
jgi:hypothetical protein